MNKVYRYAIFIWAGILPSIFGDYGIDKWQTWVTIISINLLLGLHKYSYISTNNSQKG